MIAEQLQSGVCFITLSATSVSIGIRAVIMMSVKAQKETQEPVEMLKQVGRKEEDDAFVSSLAGRQSGAYNPENKATTCIFLAKEY